MYSARSMSVAGLPCFTVSGGPFAKDQIMGWQITDQGGITCAVSCDSQLCRKINAIEEISELMAKADLAYHIQERLGQGYIEDTEAGRHLLDLLEELQKGEDPE